MKMNSTRKRLLEFCFIAFCWLTVLGMFYLAYLKLKYFYHF